MMASSTKLKEKEKTNGTEKKERKNPKKKREREERNKTVTLWRQCGPWKAPTQDKKALDITILEINKSNTKENLAQFRFTVTESSCPQTYKKKLGQSCFQKTLIDLCTIKNYKL
jgi:hypothetical protein